MILGRPTLASFATSTRRSLWPEVPSDQYVLLVDPLGFTEAVKTSSGERMNALIELMRWISTARPEFGVRVAPDGNFITPDISTFSDLAVISFPATPPLDLPPDEAEIALGLWPGEVLRHMAELVARITIRSLPLGLVVRGGLCRGELLHTADLVFGPAFIEAYRLERKVAVLPRHRRFARRSTAPTVRCLLIFFAMTPVTRSTTSITCQHFPCSSAPGSITPRGARRAWTKWTAT